MKRQQFLGILMIILACSSCSDYLDVVPDNIATIEMAFNMRSQAEKYLYTCYSYMPRNGNLGSDPSIMGGDEMWSIINPSPAQYNDAMFRIARGYQNSTSPLGDDNWVSLYKGLRDCNIFLENVGNVPDLDGWEKNQWIAEVTFLKAYYHFYLVRMYGPIPLIKKNLPIDVGVDEVKVYRDPVDSCFSYIVKLIDEALPDLPLIITNPINELGRITQPIAAACKAKVLVTAASPLFNGNMDQATLMNNDGTRLFNSSVESAKWDSAVVACKEAIDICHRAGMELYKYSPSYQQYKLTDTIVTQLSIRNAFCEKWNSEIIWANTQTGSSAMNQIQTLATANLDILNADNYRLRSQLQPPLKIAEMFYTSHGVPISEDKNWSSVNLYSLRTATEAEQLYIEKGYTTIQLHFDREPRFYADLGFDGGIWYGQGKYDDSNPGNLFYVACRRSGLQGKTGTESGPFTGYYWKKCVNYHNVQSADNQYDIQYYPWPIMRLADLYLLYAEALNESEGPGPEAYNYINQVRQRAGLPSVESAWSNYSTNPEKYTTQNGLREIIHQERLIELALEGQRFWDLRRWKEVPDYYKTPVEGWSVSQSSPETFYQVVTLFNKEFATKDYFWPIRDSYIENNRNLVQNIGW